MKLDLVVESEPCAPPPHLSPSSIGTWQQCPLRFKYGRIDKVPEPSTEAQILGSFTHEILEFLYELPRHERTPETARFLSKRLWEDKWAEETYELNLSPEAERQFRWKVWWCVEALFKMENPAEVELGGMEQKLETQLGNIKLLGILDRWHSLDDGRVVISDYKTGKKPRPMYEMEKKFQLGIYVHLVRVALGLDVAYTELLYLKEGIRWRFDPDNNFVDGVVSTVSRVADEIYASCSEGRFVAKPQKLCDWCSFKSECPAWK